MKYAPFLFYILLIPSLAFGQETFDPTWYDANATYVKLGVAQDGVVSVSGSELVSAGVDISLIDPATIRVLENGLEIPTDVLAGGSSFQATDNFYFVGRRNTGEDENTLYRNLSDQSSGYLSLFTDTTFYWLTWGGQAGLRYQSANPGTASGAPIISQRTELQIETDEIYYPGQGSDVGNPIYTEGEGFYMSTIRHGTAQNVLTEDFSMDLFGLDPDSADPVEVRVGLTSQTVSRHIVSLSAKFSDQSNYVALDSLDWIGASVQTLSGTLSASGSSSTTLEVRITSRNDFGGTVSNSTAIDYANITYTGFLAATNDALRVKTQDSGTRQISVSGFTGAELRVYDQVNQTVAIEPTSAGNATIVADVTPNSEFWFVASSGAQSVSSVQLDMPSDLASPANNWDYVIVTSDALLSSATAHAAYRESAAGGSYSVLVVRVQDIFDQFDYGKATPIAIRRFVRETQRWDVQMNYMLLWGDALYADRLRPRTNWEVLSFGHTVSDGWFAMQNASSTDYSESVAIGRIPIRSNETGNTFTTKISSYEGSQAAAWQKTAMYVVGGLSPGERSRLQSAAIKWGELVHSPPTVMDTLNFFKTSSDVLDPTFKDSLQQAFKDGASWLTYFGHSATQTWEIVTDPPATYDNSNVLPIVLSLGCFTGDFAGGDGLPADPLAFSEQLVIETINGSIAHWGASSSGTINASERLSDQVHQSVFTDTLRVLGSALRVAKERYNALYSDPLSVIHLLQYGLIGDPATRIRLPSKPDLLASASNISFSTIAPSTEEESFDVRFKVESIGLLLTDSVDVDVSVSGPNNFNFAATKRIISPLRDTTLTFQIPIEEAMIGENVVTLQVDASDEIGEESETNNAASVSIVVFSSGIALVGPGEFSLLPEATNPTLTMSTSSRSSAALPVVMQLDTTLTFDSPLMRETVINPDGLLAEWQPGNLSADQVYFWRGRVDVAEQQDVWKNGSFVIKSGETGYGWHQQDAQFEANATSNGLSYSRATGWEFAEISVDVTLNSERGNGLLKGQIVVSGTTYERRGRGFGVLVLNGATGALKWIGSIVTYASSLDNPDVEQAELLELAATAETGDYIFIRTRHLGRDPNETEIPQEVKDLFRGFGSTAIDTLDYTDLWISKTRIGFPEETEEFVDPATSGNDEITESFSPTFLTGSGAVTSVPVSGAAEWNTLKWTETTAPDAEISVEVLDASGNPLLGPFLNSPVSLTALNDTSVTSIRLRANLSDTSRTSTPQLDSWTVTYEGIAELAIDPSRLVLNGDTLTEPEPIEIQATVFNLSDFQADSVIVTFSITDADNISNILRADTLVNVVDSVVVNATYSTSGLVGSNLLRIDAVQPGVDEPISFNNVVLKSLEVVSDTNPPLFEVLVDGELFPNDPDPLVNLQDPSLPFVSSQPVFQIEVTDDNTFAPISSDTNAVVVILNGDRIAFDNLVITEGESAGETEIRFEPDFSGIDSTHTLLVRVQDVFGNESLNSPYQLHFRTQSDLELERAFPYPNPMSTSTEFAFRLLGASASEITDLHLRIYTLGGKVVRDFDLINNPESLRHGGLRIGWNMINWDGRDDDGDRVATGVYLYRLFASGNDLTSGSATAVEKIAVIR